MLTLFLAISFLGTAWGSFTRYLMLLTGREGSLNLIELFNSYLGLCHVALREVGGSQTGKFGVT